MNGRIRLLFFFSAVLIVCSFGTSAEAQTYKRNVLIEEFTGTWCGWCPYGAWNLDTIQNRMGHNAVVISWHNGDEMHINAQDTAFTTDKGTGFPESSVDHDSAVAEPALWTDNNPWYVVAKRDAGKPSPVDFRIVNATFDGNNRILNFDIDITPYDLTTIGKEDTTSYVTVGVITEDGIVSSQHQYDSQTGASLNPIDDFHHRNVVRAVGGKCGGDLFNMGTKVALASYPIRRHYHFTLDGAWDATKIHAKAFVASNSKNKHTGEFVLNADQTEIYADQLPSVAPKATWVVLPRAGDSWDPNKQQNIIWAVGGSVTAVKLEYSIDGAKTWTTIAATTTQSPYLWTIPLDAYGKTAQIRVSDVADGTVNSISDQFDIQKVTPASIAVLKPATGEQVDAGSSYSIIFSVAGPVTATKTLEYALDGGTQWNQIAQLTTTQSTYTWTVPNTSSTTAVVRIRDANNVIGSSGLFSIKAKAATISNLSVTGAPNVPSNSPVTVQWNVSGTIAELLVLSYSTDSATWIPIVSDIAGTATSYSWKTPDVYAPDVWVRVAALSGSPSATSGHMVLGQPSSVAVPGALPEKFALMQNYPNPFNPSTTIGYALPERSVVTLLVRDMLGREVMQLPSETLSRGNYNLTLNMSGLASGTYVYELHAGAHVLQGKMILSK